jgi:hypothetical protein
MTFRKLSETVERLNRIFREAENARDFPNQQHREADRVSISTGNYSHPEHATIEAAREIKEQLVEAFRARGEALRDRKLAELAAEVEMLRDILPSLAADACIDLGRIARASFPSEKSK